MFKKILPLNLIISLRMFGLFIVLPVLSIYALNMPNSSHTIETGFGNKIPLWLFGFLY